MLVEGSKFCKKCGENKPLAAFYKSKDTQTGLTNYCKNCMKKKSLEWSKNNAEKIRERNKEYREKHRDKCDARSKAWAECNRERSRQIKQAWKKRNMETVRRHAREKARRDSEKIKIKKKQYRSENPHIARDYIKEIRKNNLSRRISDNIGNQMRSALFRNKGRKSWEAIVGYSVESLINHLGTKFSEGMTWENYGEWHIDHIRPISSFDFETEPLKAAKECWAIGNLQPLWAIDNIRKSNHWEGLKNVN